MNVKHVCSAACLAISTLPSNRLTCSRVATLHNQAATNMVIVYAG